MNLLEVDVAVQDRFLMPRIDDRLSPWVHHRGLPPRLVRAGVLHVACGRAQCEVGLRVDRAAATQHVPMKRPSREVEGGREHEDLSAVVLDKNAAKLREAHVVADAHTNLEGRFRESTVPCNTRC